MSDTKARESISSRITRTIIKHRKGLLRTFLVLWVLLLLVLAGFWVLDIVKSENLSDQEYLALNLTYLAFLVINQLSLALGYIIWHKDRRRLPLVIFLALVSVIALVPIAFIVLSRMAPEVATT